MRQRAFIGIALLALSHLTFANLTSAFAQAGNTGGTIGKQDKSISGGEQANTPRAALHPKQSITKPRETSSGNSCNRIVGTWTWYLGLTETVFFKGGTARNSFGPTGTWSCASTTINVVWDNGVREHYSISQEGSSMVVSSSWGGGITFTATRK
jgi:hypothetical protein